MTATNPRQAAHLGRAAFLFGAENSLKTTRFAGNFSIDKAIPTVVYLDYTEHGTANKKRQQSMTRKMYQLTDKDLSKCEQQQAYAIARRQRADENKKKLGKRYGLECREAGHQLLKSNPEYIRGLWQGRIDKANGLDYSEERLESPYNLGYYRGFCDYERDTRGGLVIPAEYLEVN